MAATTVVYTIEASWRIKDKRFRRICATFDAGTYPVGGLAIAVTDCGLVDSIDALLHEGNDAGIFWDYNRTTGKLMAYFQDADAGADSALIVYTGALAMAAHAHIMLAIGW